VAKSQHSLQRLQGMFLMLGCNLKFREADPNTLNANDLAKLVDEPEDIFNNENY
jgi:hypothetical protein